MFGVSVGGAPAAPKGPEIVTDFSDYNASGSTLSTTCTTSAGSPAVTLAAAQDFANGQGVVIRHAGAASGLAAPANPLAVPVGLVSWRVVALNGRGGTSAQSAAALGTSGATITWDAVSGAKAYAVYADGALVGLVSSRAGSVQWAGGTTTISAPANVPSSPPSSALPDFFRGVISSGGGTTSLTLTANITSAVSGGTIVHDDTAALQAAFAAGCFLAEKGKTYQVEIGDTTDAALWKQAGSDSYAVFRLTQDALHLRLLNSEIRATFNHMPQMADPGSFSLFRFGTGAQSTGNLESPRVVGGTLRCVLGQTPLVVEIDGVNGINVKNLDYSLRGQWHSVTIVDFPGMGADQGTDVSGEQFSWNTYTSLTVTGYGGSESDNWHYIQGGTEYTDCTVKSIRVTDATKYASHVLYTGLDRPGQRVRGCWFEGVSGTRQAIAWRGSSGTLGHDIEISGTTFKDCGPLTIGYTNGAAYQDATVSDCDFLSTKLDAWRISNLSVADCSFDSGSVVTLNGVTSSSLLRNSYAANVVVKNYSTNLSKNLTIDGEVTGAGKVRVEATDTPGNVTVDVYGSSKAGGNAAFEVVGGDTITATLNCIRGDARTEFIKVTGGSNVTIGGSVINNKVDTLSIYACNLTGGTSLALTGLHLTANYTTGTVGLNTGAASPTITNCSVNGEAP